MKSPKELLRGVSDWMMFIEELKLTKYEVFIIFLSYTIFLMALFFSILAFISLYCSEAFNDMPSYITGYSR